MSAVLNLKKIHTTLGLILVIPLIGWVLTGMVFLFKPGYGEAYQQISPKFYAIDHYDFSLPENSWSEVRVVKSVLGNHLLVKDEHQWQHLNLADFKPWPLPSSEDQIRLLTDAIAGHSERYGTVEGRDGDVYVTSTGVELRLNWNTLSIYQSGSDTQLINLLYKIHYLQWLGNKQANIVLAVFGLLLLSLLMSYGVVLYLRKRKRIR